MHVCGKTVVVLGPLDKVVRNLEVGELLELHDVLFGAFLTSCSFTVI